MDLACLLVNTGSRELQSISRQKVLLIGWWQCFISSQRNLFSSKDGHMSQLYVVPLLNRVRLLISTDNNFRKKGCISLASLVTPKHLAIHDIGIASTCCNDLHPTLLTQQVDCTVQSRTAVTKNLPHGLLTDDDSIRLIHPLRQKPKHLMRGRTTFCQLSHVPQIAASNLQKVCWCLG